MYKKKCNRRRWRDNKYHIVDSYVLVNSLLGLVVLALLGGIPRLGSNGWFITIFGIIIGWRLLDLLQAWFNVAVLRIDPLPYSVPRMLILDSVGFVEVAIIFGIFTFFAKSSFSCQPSIESVWQSLYYSVATITTIGSNYTPVDGRGYLLFYGEIAFGILFLVVVIQRVLSLFPRR